MTIITRKQPLAPAPLYLKLPGAKYPQPIFITLDLYSETLYACTQSETDPELPSPVYHGHVLRWRLANSKIAGDEINYLLDKIICMAEVIRIGYSNQWNGTTFKGTLTDHAGETVKQVGSIIHNYNCSPFSERTVIVQNWSEWFDDFSDLEMFLDTKDALAFDHAVLDSLKTYPAIDRTSESPSTWVCRHLHHLVLASNLTPDDLISAVPSWMKPYLEDRSAQS